ncbi:keratin, type II cytoskeletal 2 epidermal-like [Anopheles stephensi]|uniref:Uncharacterized protein n=1 Tax=Anopheles stephensi TaxID=30069 RepID=A0A182Y8W2_ANOST|nr:keratin, type II cytoskeletal 2 epidermal-like [Anopheles stephensi]
MQSRTVAVATVLFFGVALAVPIQNSGSTSGAPPSTKLELAEPKSSTQPAARLADDPDADRNKRHLAFGGIGIGVGLIGGGFSPYDHYGHGGYFGGHEGFYGGHGGHFGGDFGAPYGFGGPYGYGHPHGFGGFHGPYGGGGYASGYHYGYGSGYSGGFFG